jgi:hypothetical protein
MKRFSRLWPLLALPACLLALAGCGGGRATVAPTATHCRAADYAMPCALTTPKLTLAPTASALAYGIDFAWSCPSPSGHGFGASYLSPDGSKNWTRGCVNWWHSAGAKTVAVWESSATRAQDGYSAGQADARTAASQAAALGEPSNRPIFFAVDFDTSGFGGPASFPTPTVDTILGYFQGVHSILGGRTGAYGGYSTVSTLFDRGLIGYGWQTYAWSYGRWDSRAKLEQYLNGSSVDYDRAIAADYGQWPYVAPPIYPRCFSHSISPKICAEIRARIASDGRAAASSERAFVARGCPGIASREGWFAAHLNKPPASRHSYRAAALAASRRAYQRNACGVFNQRQAWFLAAAARLKAAN